MYSVLVKNFVATVHQ